jgi:hypothetical protein
VVSIKVKAENGIPFSLTIDASDGDPKIHIIFSGSPQVPKHTDTAKKKPTRNPRWFYRGCI